MRALAFDIYRSLVRRGKEVFYTPIMKFAIKHYKAGRRIAGTNTTDVLSDCTRILERCDICSLDQFYLHDGDLPFLTDWRQSNVADTVQFKIDFEEWLGQQAERDQQIIGSLSAGHTTGEVARKHGVSDGLISQYRKRYEKSWNDFIADAKEPATKPATTTIQKLQRWTCAKRPLTSRTRRQDPPAAAVVAA